MRSGALSALAVLGAGIAASASPIRVVVTEVSSVRHGYAAADPNSPFSPLPPPVDNLFAASAFAQPIVAAQDAEIVRPQYVHGNGRHFCQSMRTKALDASNVLRQWLGLEPIQIQHIRVHPLPHHMEGTQMHGMQLKDGKNTHDLPIMPFIGTPVKPAFAEDEGALEHHRGRQGRPMWVHHYGHHHLRGSFLRRVHHALMALGPWEGRAVAFVLGCGIGVLLRMVWVMVLVTARAFRGSRDEETEYEVVFDEAEMLVPPPQYTIFEGSEVIPVDEKSNKEATA
ncbi:hypothetical protein DICSQDRAFT_133207 [Dichomitus squalens LYAD-421 SS1]|uniref:uncharacterized protein n=1 Tax=Dichomitus squalens (strain LYAD-421) TaxID=732165 RepID=UPI000441426D|nr:uncharacterized protein DICSQDRAFT_133207 [Dichomitus squalens LYAD-421 SS1]EJF65612.1 hypothetical protein DICSQDRAFT_133207 [Dichomitus squalens LYAD-421 SS1]